MDLKFPPLSAHRHEVRIGQALPFGICDADGRLLLAVGQVIHSEGQLEGLLERGAFVFHDRTAEIVKKIEQARPPDLHGLWTDAVDHVHRVLRSSLDPQFAGALERATRPVRALIRRDPDLAILQVVRHDDGVQGNYGNRHAVHAAIAGQLAGQRLGWDETVCARLMRAALTMNLGMSELQNKLATQLTPLTPLQRETIHRHPQRSAELLQAAGVTDADWMAAVAQHHEQPDGSGYPARLSDIGELAWLLNRTDVYTAKLSVRSTRPALAADAAARQFFLSHRADPMTAAVIKEFGLYPPGCAVRLKSGETGIVVRRGDTASTPVVAAVMAGNGDALLSPQRRDTAQPGLAVAAVLPMSAIKVRVPVEKLVRACGG